MPVTPLLPLDLLRTFVAILEAGGQSAAVDRVGRSQSALSLQIKRLEEVVGAALFRRDLRGVALTPAGETLLPYARRLLALNAEALAALAPARLTGRVRLGVVQDFAEGALPHVLARFAHAHPNLSLETRVGRSAELDTGLRHGEVDVVLVVGEAGAGSCTASRTTAMIWLAGRDAPPPPTPLPLALLDPPCRYRQAALEALEAVKVPHRIACSGPSLSGILAAVRAGLAVTVRTADHLRDGLAEAAPPLPALPPVTHVLRLRDDAGPAVRRLAAIIADELATPA